MAGRMRYLRDYSSLSATLYSIEDISVLFYLSCTALERVSKLARISSISYLDKTKLAR